MIDDPRYFPQVVQVIAEPGSHRVLAYFDDGSIHLYDVEPLLALEAFAPLRDDSTFRQTLTVLNDTVAWDLAGDRNESSCLDLDPLTIYRDGDVVEEPGWVTANARQE